MSATVFLVIAHSYENVQVVSAWNYKDNADRELDVLKRLDESGALRIEAERGFTVEPIKVLDA